jgi:predicted transcriptional regulator
LEKTNLRFKENSVPLFQLIYSIDKGNYTTGALKKDLGWERAFIYEMLKHAIKYGFVEKIITKSVNDKKAIGYITTEKEYFCPCCKKSGWF